MRDEKKRALEIGEDNKQRVACLHQIVVVNPTCPFVAISQLGCPPGERIEKEAVGGSDEEST